MDMPETCAFCGAELRGFITSMFSTDVICFDCKKLEEEHPQYAEAARVEGDAVRAGDYNFPGIGVPADLREMAKQAREDRERG